jgi:hypothetical protein
MSALVWLLMPQGPDMRVGQPVVSPQIWHAEEFRSRILKRLDLISADIKAHRKY